MALLTFDAVNDENTIIGLKFLFCFLWQRFIFWFHSRLAGGTAVEVEGWILESVCVAYVYDQIRRATT